jgi:hypothetical protein
MFLNRTILIAAVLLSSCTTREQKPSITWLYGYGQVEKINGRVKKLIEKNQNISLDFEYAFDNKGNVVKIEDRGINITNYSTVYNKNGQKIEAIGLYFDSGKRIREIYKYDNNGYMTRCIGNANDPSPDTDRFIYNNAENLVEHQQYFNKKPLWTFKFKYSFNKNDVCTGVEQSMTTWRDNFKTVTKDTTRYIVFDSKNNWLKAVNFLNDTITRKITYY